MAKVQISISDELLQRVDDYRTRNFMNRSSFFSFAASQTLKQEKVANEAPEVLKALSQFSEDVSRLVSAGQQPAVGPDEG